MAIDGTLTVDDWAYLGGTLTLTGALNLTGSTQWNQQGPGTITGSLSFDSGAGIALSNGTYTVGQGASFNGGGWVTVGDAPMPSGVATLVMNTDATMNRFRLAPRGVVDGAGDLTVTQSLEWAAGTMKGQGETVLAGGATATFGSPGGTSPVLLDGRTFRVEAGAVANGDGSMNIDGPILALAGAAVNFRSGVHVLGAGALNGEGLFTLGQEGGAGAAPQLVSDKDQPVKNFKLITGGLMDGKGTVTITNLLDWTGGEMKGTGKTRIAELATLNIHDSKAVKVVNNRTLEVEGSAELTDQDLRLSGTARLDVLAKGTFTIDEASIRRLGDATQITNAGKFVKFFRGNHTSSIEPTFTNTTGTVEVGPTDTLRFTDFVFENGLITGKGTVSVWGSFDWYNGKFKGDGGEGTLVIAENATFSLLGAAQTTLELEQWAVTNLGWTNWFGGKLSLGGDFVNGGVFDAWGDFVLTRTGGMMTSPGFVNLGTFRKAAGNGDLDVQIVGFHNRGWLEVLTGTLSLRSLGESTHTGVFTTAAGTAVKFAGSKDVLAPDEGEGYMLRGNGKYIAYDAVQLWLAEDAVVRADNFELSDMAKLEGPGDFSAHSFLWAGGSMTRPEGTAGVTSVFEDDEMVILNTSNEDLLLQRRHIINNGTLRLEGTKDLRMTGNAEIRVQGEGLMTIRGSQKIKSDLEPTDPDFEPTGKLFVLDGGSVIKEGEVTDIQVAFVNVGGALSVRGPLTFSATFRQDSGSTEVLIAGTLRHNMKQSLRVVGGAFRMVGGTVAGDLDPAGALRVLDIESGATLSGNGLIEIEVRNNGLIEVGGAGTAGVLTFGALRQLSAGVLSFELRGTDPSLYDRLYVNGAVRLFGGTLRVSYLGGFTAPRNSNYNLINSWFDTIQGAFSQVELPALAAGSWHYGVEAFPLPPLNIFRIWVD